MAIMVKFEHSRYRSRGDADVEPRSFGPYPFVQLTYEGLRVGPDGDDLAFYDGGYWRLVSDDTRWSDVVIYDEARGS